MVGVHEQKIYLLLQPSSFLSKIHISFSGGVSPKDVFLQ
jgi:hypothetical protein